MHRLISSVFGALPASRRAKEGLKRVMEERPNEFVKLVAQLLPKDMDVKHSGDITVQVVNYEDD